MPATCIIFNPTAKGDKARRLGSLLAGLAGDLVVKPTDAPGAARRLAAEAANEGLSPVIAAGGDGTVNEVVNGLADVPGALDRTDLGIIPLGTVNVFARELRLPTDPRKAFAVARGSSVRICSLPQASFHCPNSPGGIRTQRFVQLAGAGLDSRAIERVDWSLKQRVGPLAYVAAGFSALRDRHPPIRVVSQEHSAEGELVVIGNGRFYGGSFAMFPGAVLEEERIHVAVFPRARLATLLAFGIGWLIGNVQRFTGAKTWSTRKVSLECEAPMPLELEGDNVGRLPATLEATTLRVRVRASPR